MPAALPPLPGHVRAPEHRDAAGRPAWPLRSRHSASTRGPGPPSSTCRSGSRIRAEGFFGSVEFNSDLFDPGTIERFSRHYVLLLQDLVAHPERRLRELSPLTDAERRQVAAWGEGPSIAQAHPAADHGDHPPGIHGRFEACVRATPDATALIAEDTTLTYAELNGRANRLARLMRSHGAGPGRGSADPRRPDRSDRGRAGRLEGGRRAYVPLKPTAPRMRMEGMLADAGVSPIVVDRKGPGHLPSTTVPVINLEAEVASLAALSPDDLGIPVHGDNLAYIIFTSGTTGRPKGVMTEHRALLAAATAWEQLYDLRAALLRHLQAAPFAFDVFTGDWVRALTTGGALVSCPSPCPARRRRSWPGSSAATASTPSSRIPGPGRAARRAPRGRLRSGPGAAPPPAGHRLRHPGVRVARRLCRLLLPGTLRVVNSYGLTEAAIDSTCFDPGSDADALPAGDVPCPSAAPCRACGPMSRRLDRLIPVLARGGRRSLRRRPGGLAWLSAGDPIRTAERFPPDPWGPEGLADVRHRRPKVEARWRRSGAAGPRRRPGEDPRRPRRARRGRGRAGVVPRGPRVRRRLPARPRRRPAAHRLDRRRGGCLHLDRHRPPASAP